MKTMTLKQLTGYFLILAIASSVSSCKKDNDIITKPPETGKYANGFFVLNEGWYDHGGGTISFFNYDTKVLEDSVFTNENPGKDLGPKTSSLEYGAVYNNKLYLLTKYGGPLVALDAFSLKETGRIESNVANDFRAFVALDTTKALVSTSDGIYPLNLQLMTFGTPLAGISGEVGDMTSSGNYIFALSASDGVDVINANNYSVVKTIAGIDVGFARTTDGAVWAAGDSLLIRIDPPSLDTQQIKLPFEINGTFGFWHPGSIVASAKENAVFIAYNGLYSGATAIYKYKAGTTTSLEAPFITIEAGKELYAAGIGYDKKKDQLVVSTVESGYGEHLSVNDLDFYDAATGVLVEDKSYTGFYSPAMTVFHE
jgi:hypothetical protein